MNDDELITLPGADEIVARLRTVIDEPHAAEKLYPQVARRAGDRLTVNGLELMLTLAIHDYAKGYSPAVAATMYVALPDFIRVLSAGEADDER